jgi:hypothetical protein
VQSTVVGGHAVVTSCRGVGEDEFGAEVLSYTDSGRRVMLAVMLLAGWWCCWLTGHAQGSK